MPFCLSDIFCTEVSSYLHRYCLQENNVRQGIKAHHLYIWCSNWQTGYSLWTPQTWGSTNCNANTISKLKTDSIMDSQMKYRLCDTTGHTVRCFHTWGEANNFRVLMGRFDWAIQSRVASFGPRYWFCNGFKIKIWWFKSILKTFFKNQLDFSSKLVSIVYVNSIKTTAVTIYNNVSVVFALLAQLARAFNGHQFESGRGLH